MHIIQVFGVKNSPATRAAERFFKERNIKIQFIDLKQKPMAAGEIRRFIEKFSLAGLVDKESKTYIDGGLKYLKLADADLLGKIEQEPRLLRLPLVRGAGKFSVGEDPASWMGHAGEKPAEQPVARFVDGGVGIILALPCINELGNYWTRTAAGILPPGPAQLSCSAGGAWTHFPVHGFARVAGQSL